MAHAWVHAYFNSFVKRQQKLADYQSNCNIAMVSYFMCAETDEEARRPPVPMKVRHPPPGNLDLRARKDQLAHAHASPTD
jgi:hypothetical protein